jgi:hypothetical protein
MGKEFMNIDFQDIDLEQYDSIKISFSKEEKENIKNSLRKKITKRKSKFKRNALATAAASVAIAVVLVSNGNSVLANVLPAFDKIYSSIGFKSEYLPNSAYIGKTYEENGIKVTLEDLSVTKHIIKVALKVEYDNKWRKSNKPLVFFGYKINNKVVDTACFGSGLKSINENTQLMVLNFPQIDKEFPSKLDLKIEATSDAFNKPLVWDIKEDFSKNFKETIDKQVTMSKDIGASINHIEANSIGTIINSNKWGGQDEFYLKIDNKIYPLLGSGGSTGGNAYMFLENINYNTVKNCKNILLIKHSVKRTEEDGNLNKMTKEENIKYYDKVEKQLDNLPKAEAQGVIHTKKITFNNGNKAEIYNVERKDGKIRVYIKGDNKKQVFSMFSYLRISTGILVQSIEDDGVGYLVQSIEDNGVGYIAEFDDISKDKVTIKMDVSVLDCSGDYSEEESRLTLK